MKPLRPFARRTPAPHAARPGKAAVLTVLAGVLLGFAGFAPPGPGRPLRLYVSPAGDDAAPGTRAAPLATPAGAQARVRAAKGSHRGPIEVVLHGGTYFLAAPLTFTPEDAGSVGAPVTYRGAGGETVILSGGRPITGWQPAGKEVWKTTLPEVQAGRWFFRELFVNGVRKPRARTPNGGYLFTRGPLAAYDSLIRPWDFPHRTELWNAHPEAFCGFRFRAGDVPPAADWGSAEVLTHHSWESSWQTVRRVDHAREELYFNTPPWFPVGFFGTGSERLRYRLENFREALDAPGEWFLDRGTGELYYQAAPGEDVAGASFVAPRLENLVSVGSEAGGPTGYLHFRDLSFRHCASRMGVYLMTFHAQQGERTVGLPWQYIDWDALVRKRYPGWPAAYGPGYAEPQAALSAGEAIRFVNARHCAVTGSEVTGIGGYALRIGAGCSYLRIERNRFHDTGSGGVVVGLPVRDVEAEGLPKSRAPHHIRIADNALHDTGRVHPGSVGIWLAQAGDNEVIHNHLYNMPYSGISLGWTWGGRPTYTHNNLVARNHIHDVLQLLTDGGGIYTLGRQDGSRIERNYIHDISRAPGAVGSHSNGIFFDEGSQRLTVTENVLHDIGNGAVRFNASPDSLVALRNNFIGGDGKGMNARDSVRIVAGNRFGVAPGSRPFPHRLVRQAGVRKK